MLLVMILDPQMRGVRSYRGTSLLVVSSPLIRIASSLESWWQLTLPNRAELGISTLHDSHARALNCADPVLSTECLNGPRGCRSEWCRRAQHNLCPNVEFTGAPPFDGALTRTVLAAERQIFRVPAGNLRINLVVS